MNLNIRGKHALVCASSQGLGAACAESLAEAGVNLVLNARTESTLLQRAQALREQYAVSVTPIVGDITDPQVQAAMIEAVPQVDILINNAGGPPAGSWEQWDQSDWQAALNLNMLTPIALMKATLPGMQNRGWGRIVNITSGSVKNPIAQLGLSNGARAGLTGFVAGLARQVAADGVVINNLLPGIHATARATALDQALATQHNLTPAQAKQQRLASIPATRYGDPADFGAACAFLCSEQAKFIIGQNWLIDGGAFNANA